MNSVKQNNNDIIRQKRFKKLGLLIAIFFVLSIALFFLLSLCIDYQKSTIYQSTENSDVKYLVYLKENNYYKSPLDENMQYVASLIDYFNIKFNYNNDFTALTDYTYTYSINATINVYDSTNGTKKLYTSSDNLLNPVSNTVSNQQLHLDLEENLDYTKYNGLVDNLRKEYALDVNSEVIITLNVNVQGTTPGINDPIIINSVTFITIPLTEKTINISATKKESQNTRTYQGKSTLKFNNIICLSLSFFCFFALIFTIIKIIKTIIKIITSRTAYQKELSKILREYDRTIVQIENNSSFDITDDIIKVSSFSELLDVHDNLHLPILFMEAIKGHKAFFLIKSETQTYCFVLMD